MKKKHGAAGVRLPDFTLYYRATVIRTVWQCAQNRPVEPERSPDLTLSACGQSVYDRGGETMQWRKDSSLVSGAGKMGQLHVKKMKLEHFLTPHTKMNSGWIKEL